MKSTKIYSVFAVLFALLLGSCNNNDETPAAINIAPGAAAFKSIRDNTLQGLTQNFAVEAGTGMVSLTSEKGVKINILTNNLFVNGILVTGTVDVAFIEIFDGGTMAAANKSTMGRKPDGNLAMLLSGGQFYINLTKDGQQVDFNGLISLEVPAALTGDINPDMSLWEGTVEDSIAGNGNIVWNPAANAQGMGLDLDNDLYYMYLGSFGWANVDCFYNDPRQKTTLLAQVPQGYNNTNATVYLSYDGQGNALAQLDTFLPNGYFSEHYGQIPIGLQCHAIFMTESNGQYRYAIKPVTIVENGIISFTLAETVVGSKEALIAAIRAVQD